MPDEDVPVDLRTDRPTPARMYDYYLGGDHHFPADREAAEQVLALTPEVRTLAVENRAFLGRAVRFLTAEAGIRQFIDIGTGLPTQGSVHEIAHRVDPDARVVYVDNDPLVHAHARTLLADAGAATLIEGDLRDPRHILEHPEVHRLIDFGRPVAVLFMSVLHFVADEDDPAGSVRAFREATCPGSYLALSHIVPPPRNADVAEVAADVYKNKATAPAVFRSPEWIRALFEGHDLVEPGLVNLPLWRPGDPAAVQDAESVWMLAGVGRKR